jgi:hypothetical protein
LFVCLFVCFFHFIHSHGFYFLFFFLISFDVSGFAFSLLLSIIAIGRTVGEPTDFIGREEELSQIRKFVVEGGARRPVLVVVLSGMPLVGKSTLAKRLAEEFASLYADHQYYVDYKGCSPSRYITVRKRAKERKRDRERAPLFSTIVHLPCPPL